MSFLFFILLFALTLLVVVSAAHLKSWTRDGRATGEDGLSDVEKFHLITRWGAHH